ncbi:hypothetical protein BD310DRAFT_406738 [Dichomitus squalens]|uniref:Uncharacterized protein n=1 Tax=Dichomitus squalens TaxID=114155 RepID=A0A4Q9PXY2_9APHY|nr:hypothetical protein BD310DRAFT_406738 [Dichomitus squalens]
MHPLAITPFSTKSKDDIQGSSMLTVALSTVTFDHRPMAGPEASQANIRSASQFGREVVGSRCSRWSCARTRLAVCELSFYRYCSNTAHNCATTRTAIYGSKTSAVV